MFRRSSIPGLAGAVLAVISIQLIATATGHEYYLTQLIFSAYYAIVLLGLCLVMGYTGQISLGHGAFFAIGGYTSGVLTTLHFGERFSEDVTAGLMRLGVLVSRESLYGEEIISAAPWLAFLVTLVLTVVIALLVGYPALRLKGHYLAMGTLGFGLIVYRLVLGMEVTGAADGISAVPPLGLPFGLRVCGSTGARIQNYYIAWGLTICVLALILNVVNSRTGRALRSIHGNELAASAMGINTSAYKLKVFLTSALLASVAGVLCTHYYGGIGPSETGAMKSVRYVALVAAGGMANVWGVLVVGTVLNFLSLRGCFGSMDHAVFGMILILIMALAPNGPFAPCLRMLGKLFSLCRGVVAGPLQRLRVGASG